MTDTEFDRNQAELRALEVFPVSMDESARLAAVMIFAAMLAGPNFKVELDTDRMAYVGWRDHGKVAEWFFEVNGECAVFHCGSGELPEDLYIYLAESHRAVNQPARSD